MRYIMLSVWKKQMCALFAKIKQACTIKVHKYKGYLSIN